MVDYAFTGGLRTLLTGNHFPVGLVQHELCGGWLSQVQVVFTSPRNTGVRRRPSAQVVLTHVPLIPKSGLLELSLLNHCNTSIPRSKCKWSISFRHSYLTA
jgi:hypothetical protein